MKILTKEQQEQLLTKMALERYSKKAAAEQIGISRPTILKITRDQAPIALNRDTYQNVINFLNN